MTAKSNDRYSTPSATRVSLALLLTALLLFPDLALSQEPATCTGNSYWTKSGATLPSPIETFGAAVSGTTSGDVLYVIGGYNNTSTGTPGFQTKVLHKLVSGVATTNTGTWFQNSLWKGPAGVPVGFSRDLCGVVNNGYLYTVGGVFFDTTTISTGNSTNQVWYAPINPTTGNLGGWKSTTPITLPSPATGLQLHGAVVLNNYLYVIGGSTDPHGDGNVNQYTTSAVHFAPINSDGSLGQWDEGMINPVLPPIPSQGNSGVYKTCPVVHNGSIYVSGGEDAGSSLYQVVYATPSPTTGLFTSWTNNTANYIDIGGTLTPDGAQAVVYNNGITLLGGDEGGTIHDVSIVYQGVVGTGGGVTWNDTVIPALPLPISRNAGATSGGIVFSLGGDQAGNDQACVFYH